MFLPAPPSPSPPVPPFSAVRWPWLIAHPPIYTSSSLLPSLASLSLSRSPHSIPTLYFYQLFSSPLLFFFCALLFFIHTPPIFLSLSLLIPLSEFPLNPLLSPPLSRAGCSEPAQMSSLPPILIHGEEMINGLHFGEYWGAQGPLASDSSDLSPTPPRTPFWTHNIHLRSVPQSTIQRFKYLWYIALQLRLMFRIG